ncbi:MAG TPA: SusC/RagA family TonB-linked outer membrane protein [Puia sp.]
MKLTAIILLAGFLHATAGVYSQTVTLTVKNVPLTKIFREIQRQTGYRFIYEKTDLQMIKTVSLQVRSASIEDVLNNCMAGKPLTYTIVSTTIVVTKKEETKPLVPAAAAPPPIQISGTVKGPDGIPLEGVSIRIKGTNKGIQTNTLGEFTLLSPDRNAVLVISFIGYETREVSVNNNAMINVALQLAVNSMPDAVVTTALGIRRSRNSLPYAAQQVKGDEISKTRNTNFINGLSGKVAGLQISQNNSLGGSTNVILRGFKSITQNNQALFVVDGMPFDNANSNTEDQQNANGGYDYGNAATDINPDDIESITVLKGAAASALYGSRASNGVILITTKTGGRGVRITANSGITVGSVDKSTWPKYQHEYGANYGSVNAYGSPDGNFLYGPVFGGTTPSLVVPTTEDASYGAAFDPNLLVYQWDAFYKGSPTYGKATPWVAAKNGSITFFEHPVNYNTGVYIDGGGDRGTFKLGYTRTDDKGILPNSSISKDLLNFGSTYKITDRLTAGGSVNYTNINGKGRFGTGYTTNNVVYAFRDWWQTNVDFKSLKNAYFTTGKNISWNMRNPFQYDNGGDAPAYTNNPYFARYQNYETDNRERTFGNAYLNYKATDYLNVLGRVSLDTYNQVQEERFATGSKEIPSYTVSNSSFREVNYDVLINFGKDLSPDLNLKALAGANLRNTNTASLRATTNGGLVVPDFYALSNSINSINAPIQKEMKIQVGGVFAGATLSYKNMLTLDVTGRRDKSSTLPANNNAYFYPSVSGSFAFSKMLPEARWLSYGKLRANYAEVGNSAPGLSISDVYNTGTPFGTASLFSLPVTKNNAGLRPERTKSYETGLEMSFLKNRVGFDLTYYDSKTENQITQVVVSLATGYNARWVNFGAISNKGIELSLFGTPVQTDHFSWTININWSRNRNTVLSLNEGTSNITLRSYYVGSLNAQVGKPYGVIEGTDFVYTDGQRTLDNTGHYLVNSNSSNPIGNTTPKWTGGINNAIKFHSFSLSFLVDIRKGGDVFSYDMYAGLADGLYPETAGLNDLGSPSRNSLANKGGVVLPGVTADGKRNTIRADNSQSWGLYGGFFSAAKGYVYDAGYIKLREAALTYSLPLKLVSKIHPVQAIDVSLTGRNLWIIHKNLPYSDPEESLSSGNTPGYQAGAIPTTRYIGFNLKLRF